MTELTDAQKAKFTELFKEFDADGSGNVSADEVEQIMAKFGIKLAPAAVQSLVDLVDDDGSGEIGLEEFLELIRLAINPAEAKKKREEKAARSGKLSDAYKKKLAELFKQFDTDNSGHVSAVEVQAMLEKGGVKLTPEATQSLVDLVDDDNSGAVDLEEFYELIRLAGNPEEAQKKRAAKAPKVLTREFKPSGSGLGPIYTFLSGNDPSYIELVVNSIKFLKRKNPQANIGIVSPPDSGDVKGSFSNALQKLDEKIDEDTIKYIEGEKHFGDWNNSQYILDIAKFASEYDPIIYVDANAYILKNIEKQVDEFKESGKKYGFISDKVQEYPNFQEKLVGPRFIPKFSVVLFSAANIPQIFPKWEAEWKEWIEPAPFVKRKDPARYFNLTRLTIPNYSLAVVIHQEEPNLLKEATVYKRTDLSVVSNLKKEPEQTRQKWLLGGSSYSNEGKLRITLEIDSVIIDDKEKENAFVVATVGGHSKRSKVVKNPADPEHKETLVFDDVTYEGANTVSIKVQDKGEGDALLGVAEVSLLENKTSTQGDKTPLALPIKDEGAEKGTLKVNAEFYVEQLVEGEVKTRNFELTPESSSPPESTSPPDSGIVKVTLVIKNAEIYKKHDVIGKDDPYVVVKIAGVEKKTKTQDGTQKPVWDEPIVFEDVKIADANAVLQIWDEDTVTKNDLIGTANLALAQYRNNRKTVTVSYTNENGGEEAKGEIEVILE